MTDSPVFDDTYTGPRWTYGLTYRPPAFGAVPAGYIIHSNRPHPKFRFGTIQYPRPLTDAEVAQAKLISVRAHYQARTEKREARVRTEERDPDPDVRYQEAIRKLIELKAQLLGLLDEPPSPDLGEPCSGSWRTWSGRQPARVRTRVMDTAV